MHETQKNTLIGAASIFLWGCILPLVKLASENLGALGAIAAIQGGAGLLGFVFVVLRKRPPVAVFATKEFWLRAFFFVSHIYCLYFAVQIVAQEALPGVIFANYLWPSLVMIYSVLLADLRVTRRVPFLLGIVVVLLALYLEFGKKAYVSSDSDLVAYVLAFIGAHAWGLYSAVTRRTGAVSGGGVVSPVFLLIGAMLSLMLLTAGADSTPLRETIRLWPILLAASFNFIAYFCWDLGMRKGNVVLLSLGADFVPWLSLATASLLLGVGIESHTILSAALLVGGALLARYGTLGKG